MNKHVALILAFSVMGAAAQLGPGVQPVRSVSGQFVVYPGLPGFTSRFYRSDASSISTDAAVLAISAERIKTALWRQLEAKGPASGKIYLRVRPAQHAYEQPSIVVDRGLTGWAYRLTVPDSVSTGGFLNTVVHACLLEIANRNTTERSAELPLWLAEGLAQELLAVENLDHLLPRARGKENGLILDRIAATGRRANPIAHVQATLRHRAPLTFEQLSWPTADLLSDPQIEVFRSSAQLFVHQLTALNRGTACLRATLEQLPQHMNWQFAFLAGFAPHFKSQLDIEKWWALQLVQFTGRDLMQTFTLEASWERLNEIVQAPVEVRANPLDLPRRSEVTLQTIIRNWDGLNQRTALQQKLRQLDLLRPRVAQELIGVVDDYRLLLADYLDRQKFTGAFFGLRKQVGPIRNRIADNAIRELNMLDARRVALKPMESAVDAPAISATTP